MTWPVPHIAFPKGRAACAAAAASTEAPQVEGGQDVAAIGACAIAQYALKQGYGVARHVRTRTKQTGKLWTGEAVYVISHALPEGLRTTDAKVTVADCAENGIPTI